MFAVIVGEGKVVVNWKKVRSLPLDIGKKYFDEKSRDICFVMRDSSFHPFFSCDHDLTDIIR